MSYEELQAFRDKFDAIMKNHPRIRDSRLVVLMDDMEQRYSIPARFNATYASNYPGIMRLYREISYARTFGEVMK